jgi:hypothetical protein
MSDIIGFKVSAPIAKINLVNQTLPRAYSSEDGVITIDVEVIQALFRGALLEGLREEKGIDLLAPTTVKPFSTQYDPALATEEQKFAIREFLSAISDLEKLLHHSEWPRLFDRPDSTKKHEVLRSAYKVLTLELRYWGALSFLLAHEYGHLALNHHSHLDYLINRYASVKRSLGSPFCRAAGHFEDEADIYSMLLLSLLSDPKLMTLAPSQAELPLRMVDFATGYRNFFVYGYPLIGFTAQVEQTCQYKTNKDRFLYLDTAYASRKEKDFREHAMSRSLDVFMQRAIGGAP